MREFIMRVAATVVGGLIVVGVVYAAHIHYPVTPTQIVTEVNNA